MAKEFEPDIEQLRLPDDDGALAKFAQDQERALRATKAGWKPKAKKSPRPPFNFSAYPLPWLVRLADIHPRPSGVAPLLGAWLIHRSSLKRWKTTFLLHNDEIAGLRLSPNEKSRALRELVAAGLISVRPGANNVPIVTLLHLDDTSVRNLNAVDTAAAADAS